MNGDPIGGITLFIGCNLVVIYVPLFNINEQNLNGIYKTILIIISIILFITNSVLFSNKRRVAEIMARYKSESESSRKAGNTLVLLYIVLSLGLIVFS